MAPFFLPHSLPEREGIPSAALAEFYRHLATIEHLHVVSVLRHGRIVSEGVWRPYGREIPQQIFSLSKSFVSLAIGFAATEGRLRLDERVLDIFPEYDSPAIPAPTRELTLENLLTMASGQASCPLNTFLHTPDPRPFTQRFLEQPLQWKPGEHFQYNSANTYVLSATILKRCGVDVVDYLMPRLFAPLGIERPEWMRDPQGIPLGGWGLYLSHEDLRRFTLLLAQNGQWRGRQILPPEYLATATAFHIQNQDVNGNLDWSSGYGYQFWRCRHPGAFRGDGANGQYVVIVPDYDLALCCSSGFSNMGQLLEYFWEQFLPAVSQQGAPLPPDPAAQQELAETLAGLAIPLPKGRPAVPPVPFGTYRLFDNPIGYEELDFSCDAGGGAITLRKGDNAWQIPFGFGRWRRGHAPALYGELLGPVAAAAAWQDDATLDLTICCLSETQVGHCQLRFDGNRLHLSRRFHLWFAHPADDFAADCIGELLQ